LGFTACAHVTVPKKIASRQRKDAGLRRVFFISQRVRRFES